MRSLERTETSQQPRHLCRKDLRTLSKTPALVRIWKRRYYSSSRSFTDVAYNKAFKYTQRKKSRGLHQAISQAMMQIRLLLLIFVQKVCNSNRKIHPCWDHICYL